MRTPAWLKRIFGRASTDRDRRAEYVLVAVALIVAALLLAAPCTPSVGRRPAPPREAPATGAPRERDFRQARLVARRFLRGYLAVVYGREPAAAVSDAAPGILAALARSRRVPPALARLHPKVVALDVEPSVEVGVVAITATISDGEVLTYPIRLLVVLTAGDRMVVTKVGAS